MNRRMILAVFSMTLVVAWSTGSFAAEAKKAEKEKPKTEAAKPKPEAKKTSPDAGKPQLVTEGEFAKWLVQVLGLSRFLPASPSEQECFAILIQNGIRPGNGWNATNVVTRGTLARVTVQAMDKVSEVKDSTKDESYIEYLRTAGIEIGTIGEAVEHIDAIDDPLANEAVVVTTDPLAKSTKIRPLGEQQLGTDMSTISRVFSAAEIAPPPMTPQ